MLTKRFKSIINRMLNGTTQHFACELPHKTGPIRRKILRLLFHNIGFSKEQADVLDNLPPDACIVYVNKFKSAFEVLFSYSRITDMGLPGPAMAIDYRFSLLQPFRKRIQILVANTRRRFRGGRDAGLYQDDYLGRRLQKGDAVFISLVEKHDFYQRFVKQKPDPLKYLISLQRKIDAPIVIVPQMLFYSQKATTTAVKLTDIFFGSEQHPDGVRKILKALLKPEKMFVEFSLPINLKNFLNDGNGASLRLGHQALMLRRDLLSQMTQHRISTTGPVIKSFDELRLGILTQNDLQDYMKKHADRKNISIYSARRQAMMYFDEIAARYRPAFSAFAVRIIKWLSTHVFDGIHIDTGRLEEIKRMALKGPVVFVPCHRSHIDSLVMLYVMYLNHMSPPHFFAGKNLSFWPLGPILRMAGTFFVRRSFKGAVFYTKVFSAYIYELLREGFHITVFIEGTRSRSGKLLAPQLGMINILLSAFENRACRDLIFVPVSIGYERVPEEKEYLHEIEGGRKTPESPGQILKARKLLRKRYGKIFVRLNDPIGLKDTLDQKQLPADGMSSKQKNFLCRKLAGRIMVEIDRSTIATPRSVVAAALLNSQKKTRSFNSLMQQIETYLAYLASKKAPVSDSLTAYPRHICGQILNHCLQAKIIDAVQAESGTWRDSDTLTIRKNKRHELSYYKNNAITHFIPAAYTALAILMQDAFSFRASDILNDYQSLDELFHLEFFRDDEASPEFFMRKAIKSFIDTDILLPHPKIPEAYTIPSPGYRRLKQFAAFLKPFIASYDLVLKWLSQQPGDRWSEKDRIKKIHLLGSILLKRGKIEQPEALSKINLENALSFFWNIGLRGGEDNEWITLYQERLRRYMKWCDN